MGVEAAFAIGVQLVVELLVLAVDLPQRGGVVTGSGQRGPVGQIEIADLEQRCVGAMAPGCR
jgi:hypothetical protein